MFKANLSPSNFIVIIGVIIVVSIISAFGSFIGGIFSVMIARLQVLTKER